jgi:hypothetical protein
MSLAFPLVTRHGVRILPGKMEMVDNKYCFLATWGYIEGSGMLCIGIGGGEIDACNAKAVNDAPLYST